MNDIRPFRGLRYDQTVVGSLSQVVCPPYDVISAQEQITLHGRSPHNVVRLELGFEFPEDDVSSNRYTRAASTLGRWMAEGVLGAEATPAIYLYEQQFSLNGKTLARRGLLASLRLSPWEEGVVLPHEETLAKPKVDRLQLMRATECNLSPLFLLFDDPAGRVQQLLAGVVREGADVTVDTGDDQLHRLWVLQGTAQQELVEALRTPQLYMADGHHRYETALAYRDERRSADPEASPEAAYNFAMVLLVDSRDPGLVVLPTHRLVKGVEESVLSRLDVALTALFKVEKVPLEVGDVARRAETVLSRLRELGRQGPALGLYRAEPAGAVLLTLRADLPGPAVEGGPLLDVDVLHDLLIAPLLSIGAEELKAETNVSYTRDAAEALAAVDRGAAQMAFLLNPTKVDEVLETARAHGKMPQKSTYFYPKPVTGLVIRRME